MCKSMDNNNDDKNCLTQRHERMNEGRTRGKKALGPGPLGPLGHEHSGPGLLLRRKYLSGNETLKHITKSPESLT